ncbi:MAG: hypothetical protein HW390_2048 [Candidatus Brocadiaceae bacterium]|nr:hypothetical protein [Candidatus Brocadiaceae bacterium]
MRIWEGTLEISEVCFFLFDLNSPICYLATWIKEIMELKLHAFNAQVTAEKPKISIHRQVSTVFLKDVTIQQLRILRL